MFEDDPEKIGMISSYGSVSMTGSMTGSTHGSLPRVEEYPWSGIRDGGSREVSPSSIFRKNQAMSRRQSIRGNVWKSVRSLRDYENHQRMVPSLLEDNVRLFTNSSLNSPEPGILYMQEDCFYQDGKPEYALSLNHDIYLQMMKEVNDAKSIPLSLYFCCHGGDGAHTGVAHGDFVDIKVAIIILFVLFTIFLFLVFDLPWPEDDDDFFS